MNYRPEFEGDALVQLNGLPGAAFDALVERVAVLVDEPWDASVIPPDNDPVYRRTVFGAGYGLLSFRLDEAAGVRRRVALSGAHGRLRGVHRGHAVVRAEAARAR